MFSLLCASSTYLARGTLYLAAAWIALLGNHSHIEEFLIRDCALILLGFHRAFCVMLIMTDNMSRLDDKDCVVYATIHRTHRKHGWCYTAFKQCNRKVDTVAFKSALTISLRNQKQAYNYTQHGTVYQVATKYLLLERMQCFAPLIVSDNIRNKLFDVITVGSTMRIPLLYRGEYSQWHERFMNYLEEQTDGEEMINSIQNGDQPLPVIALVSLTGNAQNASTTLKDLKFWTAKEKKTRKIDRLARSLLIQGLSNDIYSLIDSNETAKDLWDALERQMRGSEYAEQDRKATILYEYETFKATEGEQLLDTYLCDVNDALGYKKKVVVVTSYPLALVAEKTKVRKRKEKVVVSLDSKGSGAYDISELKKITPLLAKAFTQRKFYSKPTNNNLRTSSTSQSANKKQEFVKSNDKKADEKKRDMSKEINANMVFMAQIEKVLSDSDESSSSTEETIAEVAYYTSESESEYEYETSEYYDNSINYGLFVNNDDDQKKFHDAIESGSENFIENHIDSQKDYDKSKVDHNDSEEKEHLVDKLIRKFNHKIVKCHKRIEKANQQSKDLKNHNKDLQEKYDVLINQEERYEYMIKYSALCDNDKQHRKKIDEQEILFDKMSQLEGCVSNKDVEIEKCLERLNECENKLHKIEQTNQTIHMIMPSKDTLYNGRKGIGFENPSYFEKAKDLRPSIYDEKVIGLGYTLMFLIHSDEALEIEKFKKARENKIEFTYDYGNLNQTSSLKPYVSNVILEKIKIDMEDEVVSLLEKEKANLKTIESLKSKGFESSENAISESENQSENDCQVVEKECDQMENSKVMAPGLFKLSVSQSVSLISMSKTSCDSNNVENLDTFSSVRRPKHTSVIWKKKGSSNTSHVDLSSTSSAYVCNDAMNVSCNSRMCNLFDENNLFIFDDESVRISPVSKMPFRKKPHDSLNIFQIYLWIIDSGCSKHMMGNRALLKNFVEKFLGTVRFGNNDFAVIAGYGDVVIGSMTMKKVYYVEGLGHNLFNVGQYVIRASKSPFESLHALFEMKMV
nr:integrase, catalytic region, zinc finger, CCHC-type, peptidase aspartic, catalytic [Tanacetum cinerariifolium]